MKYKIVDQTNLTEEDIKIKQSMPLWKALLPWIILVVLCAITNFIPQVFEFLFTTLSMKIQIAGASPIALQVFWNAWFWVIVATVLSMPFLGVKKVLKDTMQTWTRRAIRPVFSAAIFFSVAFVMTYSGATGEIVDGLWVIDNSHNMISTLATTTENVFGKYYPLIVPFVGLLGGFVSGSETSSIAMFTRFHYFTGEGIGTSPMGLVIIGAANGIGGGLASVLSPAKIQNATAVIDQQGIEGEIIKKTAPIALLMVVSVSIITLCWSQNYAAWQWVVAFLIGIAAIAAIFLAFYGLSLLKKKRKMKNEKIKMIEDEEDSL